MNANLRKLLRTSVAILLGVLLVALIRGVSIGPISSTIINAVDAVPLADGREPGELVTPPVVEIARRAASNAKELTLSLTAASRPGRKSPLTIRVLEATNGTDTLVSIDALLGDSVTCETVTWPDEVSVVAFGDFVQTANALRLTRPFPSKATLVLEHLGGLRKRSRG